LPDTPVDARVSVLEGGVLTDEIRSSYDVVILVKVLLLAKLKLELRWLQIPDF